MRLPRYLLLRPSGYTFRLVVPKHLRRHFDGRGEIRRSLRTHDPRLALAWSGALLLAYHAAIARVEKTGMVWRKNDDDELAQALGLTGGRKPKDWKVVHPSGAYHEGPDTDDKAADMAAAKEAAKFLAELYGGAGPLGPPGQRPASMTLPTPPPPGPPPGVKTFSTGAAVAAYRSLNRALARHGLSCYSFRHALASDLKAWVCSPASATYMKPGEAAKAAAQVMGHRSTESLAYYGTRAGSRRGGRPPLWAASATEADLIREKSPAYRRSRSLPLVRFPARASAPPPPAPKQQPAPGARAFSKPKPPGF